MLTHRAQSREPIIPIQLLEEEDCDPLSRLARRIWHATYPAIIGQAQTDYMLARFYSPHALAAQMRNKHHFIGLYEAGMLIGFASYEKCAAEVIQLHKLYIDPNSQGRGYGRLILQYMHDIAPGQQLILTVNRHNMHAINAYKACGLTITGTKQTPIGNDFIMDDFVMSKTL